MTKISILPYRTDDTLIDRAKMTATEETKFERIAAAFARGGKQVAYVVAGERRYCMDHASNEVRWIEPETEDEGVQMPSPSRSRPGVISRIVELLKQGEHTYEQLVSDVSTHFNRNPKAVGTTVRCQLSRLPQTMGVPVLRRRENGVTYYRSK
jgi:hypothetical protein